MIDQQPTNKATDGQSEFTDGLGQLRVWLDAEGFSFGRQDRRQQMNDCDWYAWRRSNLDARECECNGPKVQIVINPYSFRMNDYQSESVEVDVTGEAGGMWWKLTAYSLKPQEFMVRLPEIEAALISAWNAIRPNKK